MERAALNAEKEAGSSRGGGPVLTASIYLFRQWVLIAPIEQAQALEAQRDTRQGVRIDLHARRDRDLQQSHRALERRTQLQQPVEGLQAVGEALGIVDAIHADS